jgi:hypothetical protein
MTLAVDLGSVALKTATDNGVTSIDTPPGGPRAAVRAVFAAGGPRGGCCVAVPDVWLTPDAVSASAREDVRHECEDVAGSGPVIWTGQLAAVAALTAKQRGDGRYLVCDTGGGGVRAGVFVVSDGTVEVIAVHAAQGGGWRDFDGSLRSATGGRLPATWYEQAVGQERRAAMVLEDAAAAPEESAGTRVYRISGSGGSVDLTARQVIDGFAPTLERLRTAIGAIIGDGLPSHVVLVGGLSWLPLAARAVAAATGAEPLAAGLEAAARGALLFAGGEARLALPEGCLPVTVPTHRIRNGLLEEFSVTLPWTEPFGTLPDGGLRIERNELTVTVGGQSRTVPLPGMVAGQHRVGVRPTWPGPGVLVVRPVAGDNVHIVPLAAVVAA